MKCIIAGSRSIPNLNLNEFKDWWLQDKRKVIYDILDEAVKESGFDIDVVISGRCWGMDILGETWATNNGKEIKSFPANWSQGKSAGFKRNVEMAMEGDCLICIHSEGSKGSKHMIDCMRRLNKPVFTKVI